MPSHDTDVRLHHMLDAAREVAQMARGKTRADLDTDRPLNLVKAATQIGVTIAPELLARANKLIR